MGRSHVTNLLGSYGDHLHALASGLDPGLVVSQRKEKSIGSERTLEWDAKDIARYRVAPAPGRGSRRRADRLA